MKNWSVKKAISLFIAINIIFYCHFSYAAEHSIERFQKTVAVEKELDCVSEQLKHGASLGWEDVCYTGQVAIPKASARMDKINSTLNKMEQEKEDDQGSAAIVNKQENPAAGNSGQSNFLVQKSQQSLPSAEKETFNNEKSSSPRTVNDNPIRTSFKFYNGYRKDDLKFNIAGTSAGTNPNILSELTWSDLRMVQAKAKIETVLYNHLVIEGLAKYAEIYKGDVQDSDYSGDNRTAEFSRSNNKSDEKNAMDFSGGIGYRVNLDNNPQILPEFDQLWLTALAGYAYDSMHLKMTDGLQTIPATGVFNGLDSTYIPRWKGPWVGLQLGGEKKRISGFLRVEYHFVDYYAKADWNLRADFQHPKSFEHIADGGQALVFELEGNYRLNERWSLNANAGIQNWRMEDGLDRTFFSDGTILTTKLNEVEWKSYALMLGATYAFP